MAALKLTVICSLIVVAINAVFGTIIAWVLVRDDFPGKAAVNAVIDLPFALPTIVAGLTLLTLYGTDSPIGVDIAFTRTAVVVALLLRHPPLRRPRGAAAADRDGPRDGGGGDLARRRRLHRLPPDHLPQPPPRPRSPAIALAFARALGEFGSLVLISGQHPVRDRGLLGLHPQPDRVRQRPRRRRGLGRPAGRSRCCCWSRSR